MGLESISLTDGISYFGLVSDKKEERPISIRAEMSVVSWLEVSRDEKVTHSVPSPQLPCLI